MNKAELELAYLLHYVWLSNPSEGKRGDFTRVNFTDLELQGLYENTIEEMGY